MKSILLHPLNIYYICHSCLSTRHILNGISRQTVNAMGKVLGVNKKKKYHYSEAPVMPSPENFSKGSHSGKHSGNARRATILNKLFMRHVTDQMATGEYASEILGYGIVVNRVRVSADYKILKVYWLARSSEDDKEIEKVLEKTAGFLRHELSELRLMGRVPIIQFVKDKDYANIVELDRKLKLADFGQNYIPPDPLQKLKSDYELCVPLEERMKITIAEIEAEVHGNNEEFPIPPMPQNVLGLDHGNILSRVKKLMKKSEAVHRLCNTENSDISWASFKVSQPVNENPVSYGGDQSQRLVFKKFLQSRQLLKQKRNKVEKRTFDVVYTREELRERQMQYLEQLGTFENNDEDYIEDDVEEGK